MPTVRVQKFGADGYVSCIVCAHPSSIFLPVLANEAMDAKRSWTTTDDDDKNDNDNSGERKQVETRRKKIVHIV
jgi:hypothetical protein